MKNNKNVFLTDDIYLEDIGDEGFERYQYSKSDLEPEDYSEFNSFDEWLPNYDGPKESAKEFYKKAFEEWAESNLEFDEIYEIPIMNALRYYPDFISFDDEDRKKTSGATTLLYDTKKEAWAVGMTGGGMDLTAHLIDTFINLGKGVPVELAKGMSRSNNAYINKEIHLENCELIAKAFRDEAISLIGRAEDLEGGGK